MMATRSDAISAMMYAKASGASSRPSTPDSPKIGRKTSTMMIVAKTIDVRISSVASRTTSAAGRCCSDRSRRVLAQPPDDVFDVDDRVVDERADGDGHAAERHRVDAGAERAQHQHGGGQRQRHRRQRDAGRAQIRQKDEDDDDDEQPAVAEGLRRRCRRRPR